MGGYGSTRWGGIPIKYTTTECHRFDIKTMPFAEYMQAPEPHGRQYYWTQRGKPSGDIAVYFYPAQSCLIFVYEASNEQSRQRIDERIRVSKTPLHLGGFQYFIHCPECDRRGRVLYKTPKGSRFLCRDCYKLTYVSCQESHKDDRGSYANLKMMLVLDEKVHKTMRALRRKRPMSRAYVRLHNRLNRLFDKADMYKDMPRRQLPKKLLALLKK
jgi:transposase-like protein